MFQYFQSKNFYEIVLLKLLNGFKRRLFLNLNYSRVFEAKKWTLKTRSCSISYFRQHFSKNLQKYLIHSRIMMINFPFSGWNSNWYIVDYRNYPEKADFYAANNCNADLCVNPYCYVHMAYRWTISGGSWVRGCSRCHFINDSGFW